MSFFHPENCLLWMVGLQKSNPYLKFRSKLWFRLWIGKNYQKIRKNALFYKIENNKMVKFGKKSFFGENVKIDNFKTFHFCRNFMKTKKVEYLLIFFMQLNLDNTPPLVTGPRVASYRVVFTPESVFGTGCNIIAAVLSRFDCTKKCSLVSILPIFA